MAAPSSPTSAYRAQNGIADVGTYDPEVVGWITKAAHATGADPAALLATSLQESGAQRGRVGDKGTSFGPFQFHQGGALGTHNAAWANSYDAVLNRAQEFARLGVKGGKGAAAVQRPLDQHLYARGVDGLLARAHAILGEIERKGGLTPTVTTPEVTAAPARTPADRQKAADSADVGQEVLASLSALNQSAQLSHLPGSDLGTSGSLLQDLFNRSRAYSGLPSVTLPTLQQSADTTETPATPAPTVKTPKVSPAMPRSPMLVGAPGGGWGGSKNLARAVAQIGISDGLKITSEKRDRKLTASGNPSDHWIGSKNAYAFDLSNGSAPTPQMDKAAAQIAASLGVKNWKGGVRIVDRGGYRYQVLYRTNVGGNHFNHVHVGVRKL